MADAFNVKRQWEAANQHSYGWPNGHPDKRQRMAVQPEDGGALSRTNSSQGGDGSEDDDEPTEAKDVKVDKDGKPKVKLTRGSRACGQCRRLKMKCLPADGGGKACKRCKFGGHECVFEESNRGKRSTRKAEALANRITKLEAALRSVGSALSCLDRHAISSFSSTISNIETDSETLELLTAAAVPLAGQSTPSRGHTPSHAESYTRMAGRLEPSSRDQETFDRFMGPGGHDERYSSPRGYPGLGHPMESEASSSSESRRLHSLPDNTLSPLGLLAEASLHEPKRLHGPSPLGDHRLGDSMSMQTHSSPMRVSSMGDYKTATSDIRGGDEEDDSRGLASTNYFKPPSPFKGDIHQQMPPPELLNIISREDIDEMFTIFFDKMAVHVPLLIRDFHTPELLLQRSQFLCTVICGIAARFHPKKAELHGPLSAYAKRLAFDVPARGYKSVEVVQAYLLLTVWTLGPEKTFEQDRTWLMLGMAIRMATDLNLHRKSVCTGLDTEEGHARDREILNRERCWLHCFVLDRSLSAQMGKPYTIREDFIIRNSCESAWLTQRFSAPSDVGLAAYVNLQQIMSRAIDHIYSSTTTASGLSPDCDYPVIIRSYMESLTRWVVEWNRSETFERLGVNGVNEYDIRAQFYYHYSALVLHSFGLQNALERNKRDMSHFFLNVYEHATKVCHLIRDGFAPKGHLCFLPDSNFVQTSYALLSLLKLTKPEVKTLHDSEEVIYQLVGDIADILDRTAVDPSHQPAIYAAFIREIIRKTRETPKETNVNSMEQPVMAMPMSDLQGSHYDSQPLMESAKWNTQSANMMPINNGQSQFGFIPQGGDMMILPSAAGPSQSAANSMQNSPVAFPSYNTPAASWQEYNPLYMGMDGFDGWDGSMLMPGFGRGQITLSGGWLHSVHGSGVMTPATGPTPSQSRAQTPSHHSHH